MFFAAWAVYDIARWVAAGDPDTATRHAEWVLRVEDSLGVAVERSVQRALEGGAVMWLLSNAYLAAQLVVLPGALIYLYRRSPAVYARLRNTVLATWLIAIPIYALFPVAPPRLAGLGMTDTVTRQSGIPLTGHSTIFYNSFAAVPSLHCAFAFAVGIALAAAARRRWAKIAALCWGPIVSLAVVATGNHYLFDIAAGLLVGAVGYAVGSLPARLVARGTSPASPSRPLSATAQAAYANG
jgi:membrane-associated phospholipid phosphatase